MLSCPLDHAQPGGEVIQETFDNFTENKVLHLRKKNQLFKKANLQLTGKKVCRLGGLSTIHLVLYSPNFVVHYMGLHIKYRKHCSPQLTQGQQQQEQKWV